METNEDITQKLKIELTRMDWLTISIYLADCGRRNFEEFPNCAIECYTLREKIKKALVFK